MHNTFRFLVMVSVVLSVACQGTQPGRVASTTQESGASASGENVEALLSKMEQDWAAALVKGDLTLSESILADDWVGTYPDSRRITKAQHLDEIRSGAFKSESMSVEISRVRVLGDTAIVTADQSEKSRLNGQDVSARTMWTDTFMKRNGRWQIVASHGNSADESKK